MLLLLSFNKMLCKIFVVFSCAVLVRVSKGVGTDKDEDSTTSGNEAEGDLSRRSTELVTDDVYDEALKKKFTHEEATLRRGYVSFTSNFR